MSLVNGDIDLGRRAEYLWLVSGHRAGQVLGVCPAQILPEQHPRRSRTTCLNRRLLVFVVLVQSCCLLVLVVAVVVVDDEAVFAHHGHHGAEIGALKLGVVLLSLVRLRIKLVDTVHVTAAVIICSAGFVHQHVREALLVLYTIILAVLVVGGSRGT